MLQVSLRAAASTERQAGTLQDDKPSTQGLGTSRQLRRPNSDQVQTSRPWYILETGHASYVTHGTTRWCAQMKDKAAAINAFSRGSCICPEPYTEAGMHDDILIGSLIPTPFLVMQGSARQAQHARSSGDQPRHCRGPRGGHRQQLSSVLLPPSREVSTSRACCTPSLPCLLPIRHAKPLAALAWETCRLATHRSRVPLTEQPSSHGLVSTCNP